MRILAIFIILTLSSLQATAEPGKVILSVGIYDQAFTQQEYEEMERFYSYHLPDHEYKFVAISAEDSEHNHEVIEAALERLGTNQVITTFIINTHGHYSYFDGIGAIEDKWLDEDFQKLADIVSPKLSNGSRLIFNSCLAVCGNSQKAKQAAWVLKHGFDNKIDSIYASYTIENSGLMSYYFGSLPSMRSRNSLLSELIVETLFEQQIGAVLQPNDINLAKWNEIFTTLRFGTNRGRVFRFEGNKLSVEKINRATHQGVLKSMGVWSCNSLMSPNSGHNAGAKGN